ncbi:MAG: tetratricopeptide repeat protein [Acidobacteriaceae bacterium]
MLAGLALGAVVFGSLSLAAQQGHSVGNGKTQTAGSSEAPVTWSHDIAPIVYANCSTCHHPGGGGPFSLLTYQDGRRWAPQMIKVTQSRYMPPWLPVHDPHATGYVAFENERGLTDHEIELIARWTKGGMLLGNPAEAPAEPHYNQTWEHGQPDLVLQVERPYTLAAGGSDTFRNFILPYPLQQTHYIRAMEIRPSVPSIVHHANVLIDRTASYRRDHPDTWKDGIPGMELAVDSGNTFDPDSSFLFWKPDTPFLVEPASMPWRLDPGNDLILNAHLKPSGKSEVVSAQIGLYFTNTPPTEKPMLLQLEHDSELNIPAGDANFVVEDSMKLPVDVKVLGVYPHAHYLGRRLEGWATLPDGQKKWLILIPSWDIDRQSVYRYRDPIVLPKGSVLHMRYVYDNSAANEHNPNDPPIRVKAGNRSVDEMAHLWVQVLPINVPAGSPDPRLLLEEAWMRQRLGKNPGDSITLYNLGAAETELGQYKEAAAAYEREIAEHPDDVRTITALGAMYESSGDWQRAAKEYQRAIAAQTDACDARFDLAQLEMKHEQAHDAELQLRVVLEHCPVDAGVHSALGMALMAEGQDAGAGAEFARAVAMDSSNFTAQYNLGLEASQAGDFKTAVDRLTLAVGLRPKDVDTRLQLAGAYAQSGFLDDATTQLMEAVKLSPEDASIHALLSQVLAGNGHISMGIDQQKEALRLVPNDPDGWNNLGVMQAREGETVAAREDFLHALKLAPNHAQAQANLQHLPR